MIVFGQQIARHNQRRRNSLRENVAVGHLAGNANGYQFVNRIIGCHASHLLPQPRSCPNCSIEGREVKWGK